MAPKKDNTLYYLLAAAAAVVYLNKKSIMQTANNIVWDIKSVQRIKELHPSIQPFVIQFINESEKQGIQLRVTDGYRTYAEQTKLYNQGRTTPGNVVTNAKAGYSLHNFGLAVDVVPMVDGKPNYNTDKWPSIASIGKAIGFTWGGDFKSIKDKPHFEMRYKHTTAQLRNKVAAGNTTNGYVNLA